MTDKTASEKLDEDDWVMPRAKAIVRRRQSDNSDVDRVCDFPGANIPGDDFHENGAPQSSTSTAPKSIFTGSIDDMAIANGDADEAVKEEDNDVSHRIDELVESGVIEEVLDCFDFFQEMKKLKKDQ